VALRDAVDSGGVRMTYLRGSLEIMRTSRSHEVTKKQIARLLELFYLERDIPLFGYGSTTVRSRPKERGLEADECYCRGGDRPIPDVALEVVVTRGTIDKLEVYRGLGVREVWVFEAGVFNVFALRGDQYEAMARSEVLPEINLRLLAEHAVLTDQHAALRAFQQRLRSESGTV
jgi:Uma2 family endonuclease